MIEPKSVLAGKIFSGEPVVSVCVITYNHGKYIRQCLDGILMQEVTFPYEILIHDDASPDNTAEIIREYEIKYPEIIKPIYQTVNQYSQGIDVGKYNFERAVGKYIALCEGDDYWTDPKKLQMQVDFLEKHPKYVETGHNVNVITELGPKKNALESHRPERDYKITDLENNCIWKIPTGSIVFKNIFHFMDKDLLMKYYNLPGNGEIKLMHLLATYGMCHYFSECMSTYRYITTSGTSYNARSKNKNMASHRYWSYACASDYINEISHHNIKWDKILADCVSQSLVHYILYFPKYASQDEKISKELITDYINRFDKATAIKNIPIMTLTNCVRAIGNRVGVEILYKYRRALQN